VVVAGAETSVRIAVVIPCHDDGRFVEEALASLREEEPLEIVVVDDGSSDGDTLRILAALEQEGTRVVRQPNRGLAAARMAGVAATSAPYVYPLDADDRAEPGSLARQADALDRLPRAALAWGDERIFGDVDALKRTPPELDRWRITFLNEIPTAALVRRQALIDVGGWQGRDRYEDWELFLALASAGWEGVKVPGTISRHYRQHGPRMLTGALAHHARFVREARNRNPLLFESRRANRLHSQAPLRLKLLFPLLEGLPLLSAYDRQRLIHLLADPRRVTRVAVLRRLIHPAAGYARCVRRLA
jgi:glycosyltransferase involved in cell wall biosynthesis